MGEAVGRDAPIPAKFVYHGPDYDVGFRELVSVGKIPQNRIPRIRKSTERKSCRLLKDQIVARLSGLVVSAC